MNIYDVLKAVGFGNMRPGRTYSRSAVLDLFWQADHLTNCVSVRGPPKYFPHFLRKISDDLFLVISAQFCLGSRTTQKNRNFPGKNSNYLS